MTVFVVEWTITDDQHILGVFTTEEKAEKFIEDSGYNNYSVHITEWHLDKKTG